MYTLKMLRSQRQVHCQSLWDGATLYWDKRATVLKDGRKFGTLANGLLETPNGTYRFTHGEWRKSLNH